MSIPLGLIIIATSIAIWLGIKTNKKIYFYLSIIFVAILLLLQWKTSSKNSLTFLNDNEKLNQIVRLRAYPPSNIPIANWLELRKETLALYKIEANISEVVDPNLYFFANHPRERVGVIEYEKFPYILLPVFIIGLLSLKRQNLKYILLSTSPIVLNSIIGNSNPVGPFTLFPFFATTISLGLIPIFSKKIFLIPFLILFTLVFIQIYAYSKY